MRCFLSRLPRRAGLLCVLCLWTLTPAVLYAQDDAPSSQLKQDARALLASDSTAVLRAKQLFIQGLTHARIGEPEAALPLYEQALEFAPNDPAILMATAEAHAALDDLSTALFYAKQATQQDAAHPAYARRLAELQARSGQPKQALATYQRLLETTDNRTAVRRQMVSLYEQLGNDERLEQTLQAFIDEAPGAPAGYQQLAQLYLRQARPQDAARILTQARQQAPFDGLQTLLDQTRSSSSPLASADTSAPAPGTAASADLPTRAQRLYEAGRFAKAAGLLEQALRENPRDPVMWKQAADAFRQAGQPEKARAMADEGLLLFPGRLPLLRAAAQSALAADEPSAAQSYVDNALRLLEEDTDAPPELKAQLLDLQQNLQSGQDPNDERSVTRQHKSEHTASPRIVRQAQTDSTLEQYQEAVQQEPNSAQVQYNYGALLSQNAQFEEAIPHLKKATDLKPDYTDAYYNLGAAHVNFAVATNERLVQLRDSLDTNRTELSAAAVQELERRMQSLNEEIKDHFTSSIPPLERAQELVEQAGEQTTDTCEALYAAYVQTGQQEKAQAISDCAGYENQR